MGPRIFSGCGGHGRIEAVTTLLAFAFVLGVLVFVHELGHFLAAKRVGIRVTKFQLGFNPTVLSFKRGDTEYGIGALPLGGYVKMAGDTPEDVERDANGQVVRRSDEFLSKSKWERFQVLIMGPAMNIVLALVLSTIVLYQGAEVPAYEDQPPVVGVVVPNSPAAKADIRPGDRIMSVADHRVDTCEPFFVTVAARAKREITVALLRGGHSGVAGNIGCIGIAISESTKSIKPSALEAVRMSVRKNVEYAGLIGQTLWGLVTRETSPRQLMGPVMIAQMSGESASLGWIALFSFMAMISLNLGLVNLLPIPVLDGGHIFIMALEGLARRDFSLRVKEKMLLAGHVG